MKRILLLALAVLSGAQAKAELFSPESLTSAAVGGIAGTVIGHNNGRHAGEGAVIGAGVGLLAGALVNNNHQRHGYSSGGHYSGGYYSSPERSQISFGFSSGHYPHYSNYRHGYGGSRFSYGYNYRSDYYGWPYYYAPVISTPVYAEPYYVQQPVVQPAPAVASPVTIINNNYYNSTLGNMSSANAMFGR